MKEFSEGHKDVTMEPPNSTIPPGRCPRPLYSRDSTQEGHTIPHHHQSGNLRDSNVDAQEEIKKVDEQYRVMKEFFEGNVDLYKDFMMGQHNIRNPPKRCPRPLYSQDSTQEGHTIPHHHQSGNLRDSPVEVKEEIKEKDDEDGVTEKSEIPKGHKDLYQDTMVESSIYRNPPERCPRPLYSRDSTQEGLTVPHHHQVDEEQSLIASLGSVHYLHEEDRVMEDSAFPIGHKDLHQDTTVESSIYTDPPERPRHSISEDHNYARLYQGKKLTFLNVEGEVEETYVRDDQHYTEEAGMTRTFIEEDTPTEIGT
ncbi:hypothetical protein AB205_0174280, partial [Aquarana catesbeiana]